MQVILSQESQPKAEKAYNQPPSGRAGFGRQGTCQGTPGFGREPGPGQDRNTSCGDRQPQVQSLALTTAWLSDLGQGTTISEPRFTHL